MKGFSQIIVVSFIMCLSVPSVCAQHEHTDVFQGSSLPVEVDNDLVQHVLTIRVGPIPLPEGAHHLQLPDSFFLIPFDGWIIGYSPSMVDETGDSLPHSLLHHALVFNGARQDFLCLAGDEVIFGAGSEMTDWPVLQGGQGYPVTKGSRIRNVVMLHNDTSTLYPHVYFQLRIKYQLKTDKPALQNVYTLWAYIGQCPMTRDPKTLAYDLKPGNNSHKREFTIPYSGTLVTVLAHMHNYGRWLYLENLTSEEIVAVAQSKLDETGHLLPTPSPYSYLFGDFSLKKGDRIQLKSYYQNPTGKTLPLAAMGIMGGYFLPDFEKEFEKLTRDEQ